MKTLIRHDGMLVVTAETQLEAYALRRWGEENFDFRDATAKHSKILLSFPPDVLGPDETPFVGIPLLQPSDWRPV